ncbi:hypothetical protein UFOVP4_50 [uncultured Caudovirales phage]|uniref:DUF6378 domain-containing protein n=1 Tax=uncultured Caudovirales phage TaxID=2100421 RepID=A0A6J5T9I5_9CAUD|nr:hypothetical protein UFOVP4_50 [uncultured Caudovirales phage]CAB4241241.1 hypothetical protein UFOVP64_10 [uncultured Caudovirales phage]CAB5078983.1 hypothetical protein UFOVP145_24 [uncultured Caudovirales phage]
MEIENILAERAERYGQFERLSTIAQRLKAVMFHYRKREDLSHSQAEALDMIANKLARILNGDADYTDSWDDIAGYAKLVADHLRATAVR